MIRPFFSFLLSGLLMLALPACAGLMGYPPAYSAEPIEAWVVNAETKRPLEGVIITANWELRGSGLALGGSAPVGQIMVMETVTDKNGRFHFPAWGPIRQFKGELHNRDPQLILFKPGYYYAELANEPRHMYQPETILEPVRRSDWNGKTIELKPLKGTTEEYARHLSFLHTAIRSILIRGNCEWKKIPRLIVAAHKQALFFHAEHVQSSLYRIQELPNGEAKCGSPEQYFKEYLS